MPIFSVGKIIYWVGNFGQWAGLIYWVGNLTMYWSGHQIEEFLPKIYRAFFICHNCVWFPCSSSSNSNIRSLTMIWYDMIWFTQSRGPKAELQSTIWEKKGKKTHYDQKQRKKYINRQQRNKAQLWSRRAKEKIESKKFNYGSLLLINST